MRIEQTRIFHIEVNHMVEIGTKDKYMVDREDTARTLVETIAQYRGREFANKAVAKANQKLKAKFYKKI